MPPFNPTSDSPPASPRIYAAAAPTTKAGIRRRASSTSTAALDAVIPPPPLSLQDSCTPSLWNERQKQIQCLLGGALSGPSRAIAPIAIIGGTFSVYSSAIRLSGNTDLTPTSILYLVLLALNYAIMPRLSKRYIHPSTNKRSVALVEEVVKMGLGVGGWIVTGYVAASGEDDDISTASVLSRQLDNWSPLSTLIAAGVPSALYALQGTLTYTAYQNLDAVTYNGLTQLKVLSAALCCYVVLGKRQSGTQLISLALLMASTAVFQGSWRDWIGGRGSGRGRVVGATAAAKEGDRRRLLLGVVPCLAATLSSGLAGALSQRSLQTQVGMMHRDAYFYTAEISFLSAVCLVFSMGAERWRNGAARRTTENDQDGLKSGDDGFFRHWTYATLLPVATRAAAGLLTALVHRHLGSVIKGFALVLGLVFSALLQFGLEGVDLTGGQLAGTALVLLSSWLHFTNPSMTAVPR